MIPEIYIRPSEKGNILELLYFGRSEKPNIKPWTTDAEDMFPNEVNNIRPTNLKIRNPTSIGTGRTVEEAYNAALERLEARVLSGDCDCIAVINPLPVKNGALFYCYVGAELYKFEKRDWSHPIRKDEPTYKRI